MRRSPVSRVLWLLAALLQLTLPGATAWADARLEQESSSPRGASHIEAHHTSQCPRTHPPDCGLCQHLAMLFARVAPARLALLPTCGPRVPAAAIQRRAPTAPFALPQSRAPPVS